MSEEKTALARRAVACPGWMWMPGMKIANGPRVVGDDAIEPDDTPDLSDPATLGCLLALVREAWPMAPATTVEVLDTPGRPYAWACRYRTGGRWMTTGGATEAEALVAALEAAGDKTERGRR